MTTTTTADQLYKAIQAISVLINEYREKRDYARMQYCMKALEPLRALEHIEGITKK